MLLLTDPDRHRLAGQRTCHHAEVLGCHLRAKGAGWTAATVTDVQTELLFHLLLCQFHCLYFKTGKLLFECRLKLLLRQNWQNGKVQFVISSNDVIWGDWVIPEQLQSGIQLSLKMNGFHSAGYRIVHLTDINLVETSYLNPCSQLSIHTW